MATNTCKIQRAQSPARVVLNASPVVSTEFVALVELAKVFDCRTDKITQICRRLGIAISRIYDYERGKTILMIEKQNLEKVVKFMQPGYKVLSAEETKREVEKFFSQEVNDEKK